MKKIIRFIVQLICFSLLSYIGLLMIGMLLSLAEILPISIIIIILFIELAIFLLKV